MSDDENRCHHLQVGGPICVPVTDCSFPSSYLRTAFLTSSRHSPFGTALDPASHASGIGFSLSASLGSVLFLLLRGQPSRTVSRVWERSLDAECRFGMLNRRTRGAAIRMLYAGIYSGLLSESSASSSSSSSSSYVAGLSVPEI